MFNYGGRQEIVNATKSISKNVLNGDIQIKDIDVNLFSNFLYTSNYKDPELLIRTGGEYRISNFMLWQLSYSEIYISDIYWPQFDFLEYQKAIDWYQGRDRRFGGLNKQKEKEG